MGQLDRVLDGQVHALPPRRRDEVGGVAGQEEPSPLHRSDHPHPQVDQGGLHERDVVEPTDDPQPLRQLLADARLGPRLEGVGHRHLEVVAGLGRAATHVAGEPAGVSGVDGVGLERRRGPDDRQPAHRQHLLDDPRVHEGAADRAPGAVTADGDGAMDLEASALAVHGVHGDRAALLLQPGDGGAEPHVSAERLQRRAQVGHEDVLRIDEVGTSAGEGAVVEHHTLVWRPELAAAVLGVEPHDGPRDSLLGQELHGAVLDDPGLGWATKVLAAVALQDHERDPLPMQEVSEHETGRAAPDDDHRGRVDLLGRGRRRSPVLHGHHHGLCRDAPRVGV